MIRCKPSADGKFDVGIAFVEVDEKNFHILYDYFHEILGSKEWSTTKWEPWSVLSPFRFSLQLTTRNGYRGIRTHPPRARWEATSSLQETLPCNGDNRGRWPRIVRNPQPYYRRNPPRLASTSSSHCDLRCLRSLNTTGTNVKVLADRGRDNRNVSMEEMRSGRSLNEQTKPSGKGALSFHASLTGLDYSRSSRCLGEETAGCKTYSPILTLAFCLAQFSQSLLNRCLERKDRSHFRHRLIPRDLWVSLANIGSLLVSSHIPYRLVERSPLSTALWTQWGFASVE